MRARGAEERIQDGDVWVIFSGHTSQSNLEKPFLSVPAEGKRSRKFIELENYYCQSEEESLRKRQRVCKGSKFNCYEVMLAGAHEELRLKDSPRKHFEGSTLSNHFGIGMAAAALQRGGWGLRLRIADIMSICASKIHVKLGCYQKKVHLPGHLHIAT